jgi:hypothetical protein
VDLYPDKKEKAVFSTGQGLWQFMVMPVCVCNMPAVFERTMETILRDVSYESCLMYLDDVIMIGRTIQEHLFNLQ